MTTLASTALAAVLGIAVTLTVYHSIKQVGRVEGQAKERARVETVEKKIDAKIKRAQSDAARKPAPSVLDKWSRE